MVSLQTPTSLSKFSCSTKLVIRSSINVHRYMKYPKIIVPKISNNNRSQKQQIMEELNKLTYDLSLREANNNKEIIGTKIMMKLYAVLEAVSDRIELHRNVCQQRENWNSLLLNAVNMITLTAATMAGLAEGSGPHAVGLKVSSTVLFAAGTGILLIMNRIQPSQLVEEQRNAVRLFKQLRSRIQTTLSVGKPTEDDVEEAMQKVLALDKAYPLPLIGAMLEKFPSRLEPAVWWPSPSDRHQSSHGVQHCSNDLERNNGWSKELEDEMREIIGVAKSKDVEDYVKLGNKALMLNKMLAVLGPLLTGVAAVGAACSGHGGPWGGVIGAVAGSMAAVVNTIEHGGQVGMVFEMYRNCAGFFRLLEENVESTLEERDVMKRENGEVFEMKMGLNLGRSLSEIRDLADKSRRNGGLVDEFASKIF